MSAPISPQPPSDVNEHGDATRRGLSWNLGGAIATNGMRLISVAVLGRLLTSSDFGIVAAATSVLVVLHNLRDIGLGPALVQRENIESGHITTAFATSVYLGLAFAAAIVVGAPLIGELYGIPESVDVLRALGVIFAIRGVATVSSMMTQRAMNFRSVAIIDAVSYAIGTIVSMTLAVAGFGPWSLVGGYLTEEAVSAALYLRTYRPPASLRIDRDRFGDLMSFGAGQTVIQIGGVLATQGDNFVVGRMLGKAQLGFYTRAYDLIKFPSAVFTSVVGSVLFPAFSRLQSEPDRMAAGFRRVQLVNALVLLPLSAALIAVAPEMIRILMGPNWSEAVLPFRILAITIMFRTNYKVGTMVASAAGRVNAVAIAHVVYMIAVIGGAAVAVRWGISGVAVSTAISITLIYLLCAYLGMIVTGTRWSELAIAHVPGLVLGAIVGGVAWAVATGTRALGLHFAVTFTTVAITSGVLLVVGLIVVTRGASDDLVWLRGELARIGRRFRRRS